MIEIEKLARVVGRTAAEVVFKAQTLTPQILARLPLGCGQTALGIDVHDHPISYYDQKSGLFQNLVLYNPNTHTHKIEKYSPNIHGEMEKWIDEGEPVGDLRKSVDGKTPIHRHPKPGDRMNASGAIEYVYE